MTPTFQPDNNTVLVKLLPDSEMRSLYDNIKSLDGLSVLARIHSVDAFDDYAHGTVVLIDASRAWTRGYKLWIDGTELLLIDIEAILGRIEE